MAADGAGPLLEWFGSRARDVPWREDRDPYRVWVAEVMAQQTRLDTVIPYHARFMERFPTIEALAAAPLDDVLEIWAGLGYYARARHLHAAAGQVVSRHGGELPREVDELRELSGVGPYTAGAVASIAFGVAEPAVDGNARRVLSRLFDIEAPTPARLDAAARALLGGAPGRPAAVNQALMDLGGSVCTPRTPNCPACPLEGVCMARAAGTVALRPPRHGKAPTPTRWAASALVRRRRRVLLARRPPTGLLGGLWDLPGTRPADEPADATERARSLTEALVEQYGLRVDLSGEPLCIGHAFSHFRLELEVHPARWRAGMVDASPDVLWVEPEDIGHLGLPAYLRPVVAAI